MQCCKGFLPNHHNGIRANSTKLILAGHVQVPAHALDTDHNPLEKKATGMA